MLVKQNKHWKANKKIVKKGKEISKQTFETIPHQVPREEIDLNVQKNFRFIEKIKDRNKEKKHRKKQDKAELGQNFGIEREKSKH